MYSNNIYLYIESSDAYSKISDSRSIRGMFNLSDVPKTNPCPWFWSPNDFNARKVKVFTDETNGNPRINLVALKLKIYS